MHIVVRSFFDENTSTFTHVVHSPEQPECAIIDAVLGYDSVTGASDTRLADEVKKYILANGLQLQWLLETHVHADHLSAASYLQGQLGGTIGISARVQEVRGALYGRFGPFEVEPYNYFFQHDESFAIGKIDACALAVPGHTPADIAFQIGEQLVFAGDTLFPPDVGTARCDFPGGDARVLFRSISRLLSLPGQTRLFMCHDYPPTERSPIAECSVAEQRKANIHVRDGVDEDTFVAMRTTRDKGLAAPRLFDPSMRANLGVGSV